MADSQLVTRRNLRLLGVAAMAGIVVGAVAVYVNRSGPGNDEAASAACAGWVVAAQRVAPLATGEVAAFRIADKPDLLTDLVFSDADHGETGLADFAGKTVLLNLWATWCAPCLAEMPALDRLQARLGGPDFTVVAVNVDARNDSGALAFLAELGVSDLAYYVDREAAVFNGVRRRGLAVGLPTTLLIDDRGCLIGAVEGPAAWDSPSARALITAAMAAR